MLLDRHRVAQLIELSRREQVLSGAERQAGEEDVALFLKTAYDDATKPARSDFMRSIGEKDWPWCAVHSAVPVYTVGLRSAGAPPALTLLRGQADSPDADPGNRLPERGTPTGSGWEPLYQALDAWDTQTITRAIGPQGWVPVQAADAPYDPGLAGPPAPVAPEQRPLWANPMTVLWTVVALATGVTAYDAISGARSRRRLERQLQEDNP